MRRDCTRPPMPTTDPEPRLRARANRGIPSPADIPGIVEFERTSRPRTPTPNRPAGQDGALEHPGVPGLWGLAILLLEFLDEDRQREQIFRLVPRALNTASTQPVEQFERMSVFLLGANDPQGILADQIHVTLSDGIGVCSIQSTVRASAFL